jgi:hypothetical protein
MFPAAPGGIAIMNGFRCRGAAVGSELQERLACAAIAGRLEVRASSDAARLGSECARRGLSAQEYEHFVRRRLPRRASRPLRRDAELVG